MAFRRRRSRSAGRSARPRVVWDTLGITQADLPSLLLDSTQARDGAMSAIKRFHGGDVTLLRTIFESVVRIQYLDFPVVQDAVLELCIGLTSLDSSGDAAGLALNTSMALGTGPLSDADNSRWFARCCVQIPLGVYFTLVAANDNIVLSLPDPRGGPGHTTVTVLGGGVGAQEISVHCKWDSKTKRRWQGAETEWITVALEASISSTPAVGDDITVVMNSFNGRIVRTMGATAEP